jgi:hypothetical protein
MRSGINGPDATGLQVGRSVLVRPQLFDRDLVDGSFVAVLADNRNRRPLAGGRSLNAIAIYAQWRRAY